MGRRSFFFKDYVAHLILIVCAFALAGVVFCYQMSSYALHAKQTELRTTVQSLAEQSKLLEGTDSDVIRQIYVLSIARVAKEDELTVLITDADGNIEMGAKPDGTTYTLPGYHISNEVVAEMHKNGSYASVGSLGVLSESSFYTVGTCVKDDNGDADLMIFVSTQDPNSAGVVRHSTQTLVLIMLVREGVEYFLLLHQVEVDHAGLSVVEDPAGQQQVFRIGWQTGCIEGEMDKHSSEVS